MEKINQNLENVKKNLDEKILNINKNTERIKILEENFEKIEKEKMPKNKETTHFKKGVQKFPSDNINKNKIDSKNALSIVKEYIEGNLKNNQLFYKK